MPRNPFFDSLVELARDPGAIGDALKQLPDQDWILPEADRWANPWGFLLGIPNLPVPFQRLFQAGQSQRVAWIRIAEIAIGAGSIEKSWFQEMDDAEKARDLNRLAHARQKVCQALWRFDRSIFDRSMFREWRLSNRAADGLWKINRALYEKTRRKHGCAMADDLRRPVNRFKFETITAKIAWVLGRGWLRNEKGAPGYCFFGDSALCDVLEILLTIRELPFDTVRKTRQFVGLEKAPIFIYSVKKIQDGSLNLLDGGGKVRGNVVVSAQNG